MKKFISFQYDQSIDSICKFSSIRRLFISGERRKIIKVLDDYEKFTIASNGFKYFLKLCTDLVFEKIR